MTTPKKQKLLPQLHCYNESEITAATALTRLSSLTSLPSSNHNLEGQPDPEFGEYNDLDLDVTQKHETTGKFRERIPLMQVHEVDGWLLESLGKQLETCIFPTAKMMRIDPNAVKRMLDNEFRKAYGIEIETIILDPNICHDKQRDAAMESVKVDTLAEQQKGTPKQFEHSSGGEGYHMISSVAIVDQDEMRTPKALKRQEFKPQISGKAFSNIPKSRDHYQDSLNPPAKQKCADIRMVSGQKCTSSSEPTKHSTTALTKKSGLHTKKHDDNVCFRNISESRKKALQYQAKQHKQRCGSYVITLSSKIAAVRWQELERISPVHAYVEKIKGQCRHGEADEGDKRGSCARKAV